MLSVSLKIIWSVSHICHDECNNKKHIRISHGPCSHTSNPKPSRNRDGTQGLLRARPPYSRSLPSSSLWKLDLCNLHSLGSIEPSH